MGTIQQASDAVNARQLVGTTYIGLGGDASMISSIHIQWDATLATTITIWTSNFPEVDKGSTTAGDWVQQNPPTGYTAISPGGAATAATPLVLSIPGGTAGGADLQIGNCGSGRLRAVAVTTVVGNLRIRTHGKQ